MYNTYALDILLRTNVLVWGPCLFMSCSSTLYKGAGCHFSSSIATKNLNVASSDTISLNNLLYTWDSQIVKFPTTLHFCARSFVFIILNSFDTVGSMWLSGRLLASRSRSGRSHWRHCVVSLSKTH